MSAAITNTPSPVSQCWHGEFNVVPRFHLSVRQSRAFTCTTGIRGGSERKERLSLVLPLFKRRALGAVPVCN